MDIQMLLTKGGVAKPIPLMWSDLEYSQEGRLKEVKSVVIIQ
jgi:hypothetical protein